MSFFVIGGTLQSDAPSYVEREADRQLYEGLLEGDFCYVLTSRQMGKSSLMVRTANRLRMAGVHVAVLDLTALGGQNITPQQWYFGLLETLGQEMGLCNELEAFWQDNEHLGPLHRFIKSLRHIVLPRLELTGDRISPQPGADGTTPSVLQAAPVARIDDETPRSISTKVRLVIFVDEIDFVRSLPFSTDEFFAAIRECYNHRTRDSAYEQVTFCLLGVASPSDLIRDTRTTPFNIGRRIVLNDFTPVEAAGLVQGLEDANRGYRRSKLVLDRILHWTKGHPYLTQRLCQAAAEALRATDVRTGLIAESPSALVDRLCADLFFSSRARQLDDNLIFVRERLLRNDADPAGVLGLYLKVWQGKRVMDDEFDPLISLLGLSGVARVSRGRLTVRNRIYACVFDDEWVRSNLPEAELRRQREAYRRGMIRATARAAVIIVALGLLSIVAVYQTFQANLAQAKTWRSSGRIGQRVESLRAIESVKWLATLFGDPLALRNEAIASLNLVDLEKRPAVVGSEHDVTGPELNATFSSYAVADRAGGIRIMDIERRTVELALAPVGPPVRWLRFSSADEYLAVQYGSDAGGEQCFVLWRLMDKSRIFELGEDITRDAWDISKNGNRLAIGLSQQDIRIYSLPGGELLPEKVPALAQREEERRTSCLRFDPSGMRLASCSKASLDVQVWSMADSKIDTISHRDGVVDLDWHPDGHQLATACQNGDIYLIDLESKIKDRLFGTSSPLRQPEVCFNHLGTVLAAICRDSSLRLWRPENRRPILASFDVEDVFEVREGVSLRFSADDRRLNLNAEKRRVRLLQVEGGRELVTLHGELGATDAFHSIAFDPHGRVVMAAGARGAIRLWDTRDPQVLGLVNLGGLVSTVKIDRDGTTLLGSTTGGFFQLPLRYDRQTSDEELHIGPTQCLGPLRAGLGRFALTTNGTAAVVHVGKKADQIQVFPLRDPERDSWWTADTKLHEIAIAPDGRWLFGCASEGRKRIQAWDLFGAKRNEPPKSFFGSRHFALSPSGRWLVTPWAGLFRFWRVGTWRESALHIRQTHPVEQFSPVAFASLAEPDECLLAVATTPTTVELFRFFDREALRFEKLFELESPDRLPVVSLAIDGTFGRLAAGSDGQIVQIWDLAEIREKLHQRGIASGLPKFAPVSSTRLRFIVEPSTQSEEAKAALQAQEVWLITVEELTEKIKMAERNGGSGLSSNLVERAQRYRVLNRPELALDDFERALKLRPDDELTRRRKAALEQEIMSKRR